MAKEKFWRDEGLQRRVHSARNRAGQSPGPAVVLRMDNAAELIPPALQSFCAGRLGLSTPSWASP